MWMEDCVFCDIVSGDVPCHRVWEDDEHLAFLDIHPNTEGCTVVITKDHYSSYAFDLPDDVLCGLTRAAKQVGRLLDERLDDVGRTGMIFEGFGVDHVHAKLVPMHGTADMDDWERIESNTDTFFDTYPGYLSSHTAERADDEELEALAATIRGETQ